MRSVLQLTKWFVRLASSSVVAQVNLGYNKFSHLERACSKDLTRWLATLYISVTRLPREELDASGAVLSREFDMEIAYTSQLLRVRGKDRSAFCGEFSSLSYSMWSMCS